MRCPWGERFTNEGHPCCVQEHVGISKWAAPRHWSPDCSRLSDVSLTEAGGSFQQARLHAQVQLKNDAKTDDTTFSNLDASSHANCATSCGQQQQSQQDNTATAMPVTPFVSLILLVLCTKELRWVLQCHLSLLKELAMPRAHHRTDHLVAC